MLERIDINVNSIVEAKNLEAQGFLSPQEMEFLTRDAFLQGRISQEDYREFMDQQGNREGLIMLYEQGEATHKTHFQIPELIKKLFKR